ncbi:T9SS type A sorting domain-containing protein [Parabacteroides chinchillae]|uniref:Por secretion system C-terminal sorting domain-containing protein n=1 Tax=Parabacteroides chinchillae TaxID=871327 RepID=A0A8G2F9F0_9BACT|nr:Por secretion system C-terminal sorting domain-containing protein [Parabacteroides chinchillae]
MGNDLNISIISDADGNIFISSPNHIQEVILYDINGHLLNKQLTGSNQTVSISYKEYPAGIYIIHIYTSKGKSSHKFIKNR